MGQQSFFNDICPHVCYTKSNNAKLKNKGINEAKSLLAGLEHFQFRDDDMIIKLTGRYHFISDKFIQLVEANQHIDAFVKRDEYGQGITGCFAMRCKYLKDMLKSLNLEKMESEMINIESEVAQYLKKRRSVMNLQYVNTLGVVAPIFGTGERVILQW